MTDPVQNFKKNLNEWGKNKVPFVFLIDYAGSRPRAWKLDDIDPGDIQFDLNGFTNITADEAPLPDFYFYKFPVRFSEYLTKFRHVRNNLLAGNSFLVNFSLPTHIDTNLSLYQIFRNSEAPYRFWWKDQFTCFSPEIFVRIKGKMISSFPMKGTIDASVPDAEKAILDNQKEAAEHATIVDLIRNDLSMVAEKVWVKKYRYLDRIQAFDKVLLQVSSEVSGILPADFDGHFGDILMKLLPAGSITGAPKPSTIRIIGEAENYDRGYYTGVMGYFDGENFESAVMIRFIEQQGEQMVFKSGGGITALSQPESEYQELIDKVYLPFGHVPHIVH